VLHNPNSRVARSDFPRAGKIAASNDVKDFMTISNLKPSDLKSDHLE